MRFFRNFVNAGILGLLICGVFLRFVFLFIAFEYDELFTAVTSNPSLSLPWIVKNWLLIDVHPPLYNILLYLYNCLYYIRAEWWLRVPSVCFSLLSVWAAWRMCPLYLGRTVRLIFAGLWVCSFQLMLFAPQARSYSLLGLLSLVHMFISLDIWRRVWRGQKIPLQRWLCWAVSGGLLGYTHYFGVAVFCAGSVMLAAGLCVCRKALFPFLYCFGGAFGGICLWMIPNLLSNLAQKRFAGNWWAAEYTFTEGIFQTAQFIFGGYWIYLLICIFCFGVLVWEAKQIFSGKGVPFLREKIFLFGVVSIVVLTVFLLSIKLYLLVPRFFIVLFPYIYLFVAVSAGQWRRSAWLRAALFGLCAWNIFTFSGYAQYRYLHMPDNAKEFSIHFLREYSGKKLFIFVLEGLPVPAMQAMFSHYIYEYYGRKDVSVTVLNPLPGPQTERILRQNLDAVIWLPNCSYEKIKRLRQLTGLAFSRVKDVGSHCELGFLPEEAERK